MNSTEFINLLIEEIEIEQTENITIDTELESIEEWDSMAAMILIALVNDTFGVKLTNEDIKKFDTIQDIINKIGISKFS